MIELKIDDLVEVLKPLSPGSSSSHPPIYSPVHASAGEFSHSVISSTDRSLSPVSDPDPSGAALADVATGGEPSGALSKESGLSLGRGIERSPGRSVNKTRDAATELGAGADPGLRLAPGALEITFVGVTTDSRGDDLAGRLFIPLKGDQFDGHDFISAACEKGVHAVLYESWRPEWQAYNKQISFIAVTDTLKALQTLGTHWRRQCKAQVIGITGSNGKTTTKDFLGQLLQSHRNIHVNKGSFNNHWGVPLTLLELSKNTEVLVTEMGMNSPGEIQNLVEMAEPDWVGCTNVGRAHYGFFSTLEDIASAKEEIYRFAKKGAKKVFNKDNVYTAQFFEDWADQDSSLTFSLKDPSADVYFSDIQSTPEGFRVSGSIGGVPGVGVLRAWGRQNVENLAAAVAFALGLGLEPEVLWQNFSTCSTGWGRNQWLECGKEASLLFDGYNANPESFRILLENLELFEKSRTSLWGLFGEMLELGSKAAQAHYELGALAGGMNWEHLAFIGPSGDDFARGFSSVAPVAKAEKIVISNSYEHFLDSNFPVVLEPQTLLVVKGSRGLRLERWVQKVNPAAFEV